MKLAGEKQQGPQMPLCDMPGCSAWGSFGNGRGHRCRQHVWDGFLPGSVERLTERDPATLPPLTLADSTPARSQGRLL